MVIGVEFYDNSQCTTKSCTGQSTECGNESTDITDIDMECSIGSQWISSAGIDLVIIHIDTG